MKLFLAGEGSTELGDWARTREYREGTATRSHGVIEALVARCGSAKCRVVDGQIWKKAVKYRAGDHRSPETRTVLGLALKAHELKCDALVFVRDRDRDLERDESIARGVLDAEKRFEIKVVGGLAIEETESWILALLGELGSERHPDPKQRLADGHGCTTGSAKVDIIRAANLEAVPEDAVSLRAWLALAKRVLATESSD